jgi:hypothetical protein
MEQNTSPNDLATEPAELAVDRRSALRLRAVHNLTQLMTERADLKGVNGFADFVDDAVRWCA